MLIHPHIHHRRAGRRFASGLTLIELLVVLMVLIALAGIVIPNVTNLEIGSDINGQGGKSPQRIVTETTLLRVRAAIMGDETMPGLWQDLGGRETELPQEIPELFVPRPGWPTPFDPNTHIGWRGPYIQPTGARLGFKRASEGYGDANDPAILDGWGRPIVIQVPDADHIRLVSAGPSLDDNIDTPPGVALPTRTACGDDIVLFLRVPDTRLP